MAGISNWDQKAARGATKLPINEQGNLVRISNVHVRERELVRSVAQTDEFPR